MTLEIFFVILQVILILSKIRLQYIVEKKGKEFYEIFLLKTFNISLFFPIKGNGQIVKIANFLLYAFYANFIFFLFLMLIIY
jgi:hypothetical protein